MRCKTCGQILERTSGISQRAQNTLRYMATNAPKRGGYMFEGARPAYEAGTYHDAEIDELLRAGFIAAHEDSTKGWIVTQKGHSDER